MKRGYTPQSRALPPQYALLSTRDRCVPRTGVGLTDSSRTRFNGRVGRVENRVFRASLIIRAMVLAALATWLLVLGAAVVAKLPSYLFATIAFFIAFFCLFAAYYCSMTYVVDEYGVTYRGATDFVHFAWEDIVQVNDSEFPLGGWYVSTRNGGFVLPAFVTDHRVLVDLIVSRAGLFPLRHPRFS
jgi:hypothetical protein